MLARFSKFVIRLRKYVILATVVITAILGYFVRYLRINPDFTSYLPKNDQVVQSFDRIGDDYGGNLLALIALEADDIFKPEVIGDINNLTSELEILDGVSYVTSMTSVLDIKTGEQGIEIGRLINKYDLPTTDQEFADLREYALSKEMYRGRLISEDGTATLIVCRLQPDNDEIKTARQTKNIVEKSNIGEKAYFGGLPFVMLDVSNMIINDLKLLLPLVALLILFTLFLSFRTLHGVLLPLTAVGISTVWTIGLMCMLKVPISIVSDIIPVILFAVGSAYSIHVISRLNEGTEGFQYKDDGREHNANSLTRVILPVGLAAFTTIVGFLSFVFGSYLTTIREFGIFASFGVFFAFVISVTFVPALASYLNKPKKHSDSETQPNRSILRKFNDSALKHPRLVVGVSVVFIILAGIGVPKIQRKVDILDYFKTGTDVRLSENFMKEKFGGSMPVQIMVKGDILDPDVLSAMKRFQAFLQSYDDINHAQSVADLIEESNFVIGEGRAIPDSRAKVSNLWFLLEGEETMTQFVNADRSEAIIQATLESSLQTDRVKVIVEGINEYIENNNTAKYTFEQTGMPSIHYRLDESIKRSLIQSIVIAAVAIFITVFLLLRSFSGGLIGLIPITFSLLGILGFMGILKIPLDIATVLVGSVSMGIGIDYTIHFLNRFKNEYGISGNKRLALEATLQTTGKAISINVIAVTAGFLALLLANLIPLQRFGILIAITMLASGYGAVVILPAVILLTKSKFSGGKNSKEDIVKGA